MTIHGALVEVAGVGVLLLGPSGAGKSECALELLGRGHRLVADDRVVLEVREGRLWGRAPASIRHAIEIRVNAEDPARGFTPAPGLVTRFRPPLGPGVRVDTAVREGGEIPPYYDSLIAKVIAWDETRPAAIDRTLRALRELEVEGIPTTRELALDVLGSPEFRRGEYSTSTLSELQGRVPSLTVA